MKLSHFNFDLPKELLAEYPSENRDEARLMVVDRKTKTIEHRLFKDIIEYFDEGDVMVLNDTKVFPARLYGNKEKTGARIEVFLLRELNAEQRLWDVLVDPARKIRIGNKLYFGDDESLVAEVMTIRLHVVVHYVFYTMGLMKNSEISLQNLEKHLFQNIFHVMLNLRTRNDIRRFMPSMRVQ